MKEFERNARYFKQNDVWRNVGAVLAVVGVIFLYFGWSAFTYYAAALMIPVGVVLFIVVSARAVPESEVRQNLSRTFADVGKDVTENERLRTRILQNPAPFCAQESDFGTTATLFRRTKDAKLLSDVYVYTMLYFTEDALLLRSRRAELAKGCCEDTDLRLEWQELGRAELVPYEITVRLSNTKRTTAVARGVALQLIGRDEEMLLRVPIQNDIGTEQLCKDIARMVAQNGH